MQRDILPYKNEMYRLALRITLNSQEAEDVVQDVIIKIWKMREQLQDVENIEAYLMKMTRNLSLDRQRMKVNQSENIDGRDFTANTSVEENIERQEQLLSIRKIMEQLPEKQRTAMMLRDFEGKSYKEISDIMQITEDQVKVSIFRARQFVKAKLIK
ncbi:MAG: RNA polymerase sigma factor [Prevotella sp.]|nr:RNA polymerase sigma factor [Candidatus Prevotella equi]